MSKKPRGDAKLKTLPPALQAEVYGRCNSTGYAQVKAWLAAEHSVQTSTGALSEFFSWYPLQRQLERAASFADQLKEQFAKLPGIQIDAEKTSALAQVAFEMMAVQNQDPELFFNMKKLRQKDADLRKVERRIALLEKAAAERDAAKAVLNDKNLTEEQQAKKIRGLFGMGA